MAKLQKKFHENHDNDWLNTYADMVTLLLTFFVMLYASSSLDEQKWQYIYQAFQSHGKYLNEYVDTANPVEDEGESVTDEEPEGTAGDGELPQSFDQLYVYLSDYVEVNDLGETVSVEKGAAHITIRFDDSIFFDPDSAELKAEGREVINGISPGLTAAQASIKTLTVVGHTAAGVSAVNDWELSAGRAVSVVTYMDYRGVLPSDTFRVKGCGPAEPIADNDTEEGRAQNRRVEMMILKNDLDYTDSEVLKDILKSDYGITSDEYDPDGDNSTDDISKLPDGSVDKIIGSIESLFSGDSVYTQGSLGPDEVEQAEEFIFSAEASDDDGDAEAEAASTE